MKNIFDDNFLLHSKIAEQLYHDYARDLPIIDYHNHLSPKQIADNTQFENLTQVWLSGDHYKWRAMRANGIAEKYITGDSTDAQKFQHWAATVPYTMRNPLYHWTHLELQRYFGIDTLLDNTTAIEIYNEASKQLQQPSHAVQGLLAQMNVEVICTTDDPLDTLVYHQDFKKNGNPMQMFPAFRPDKAMDCDDLTTLNAYIDQLEHVVRADIHSWEAYLNALKSRHDYFHVNGCRLSDHGLAQIPVAVYTEKEIDTIFIAIRNQQKVTEIDLNKFRSALIYWLAIWNAEKGWTQQFHLGAIRNNNSRLMRSVGADVGADSIGDNRHADSLSQFLDKLDKDDKLAKTILYNLNPADNEVFATMAGNFNDGSIAAKVQWGAAWWFLDQKDGITKQFNTLSNLGLVSRMVGMLTDSRSFLSFPRHEYFRRIICNLFAEDIVQGELPQDITLIGKIIQNISYYNAKNYFQFNQ